MNAMPAGMTTPYDTAIYTYFRYDCKLSDGKKACLYRNIYENQEYLPEVFEQYRQTMMAFTKTQFEKKNMSENLAPLYLWLYQENKGNRRILGRLQKMALQVKLTTSYSRMRQVVVLEESGEQAIPLSAGPAWFAMPEDGQILLQDEEGFRYADPSYYMLWRPLALPRETDEAAPMEQIKLDLPKSVKPPKRELTVEEQITRALFTEEGIDRILPEFLSYAKEGGNARLVQSFLCYYSFRYLYQNNGGNDALFALLYERVLYEDMEIGRMALLKWMSRKSTLTEDEKKAAALWLDEFASKGIILPFFRDLGRHIPLPSRIQQRYYVEYHADPQKRITIHYAIGKMGEMTEELMPHCYKGIFVKEFLLFADEELYYYVTEEGALQTEPKLWHLSPDPYEGEDTISLQGLLNLLVYTREQGDLAQVKALVEDYSAMRQVLRENFKPL